jgi:poly [ADP-ribose] polymerase
MKIIHEGVLNMEPGLSLSQLIKKGEYDSVFAHGGYDLRNNEFIIYSEPQCTIKYLVEVGH